MPNITRRNLLKQSPAALAVAAVPTGAAVAALPAEAAPSENPELIAAYGRFLAARAEVTAAKDALEWLADEWRHLWPVAPQEILSFINARDKDAERDIAGRLIMRDTADLTKRMSRESREITPRTCFAVYTPDQLQETVEVWERPRAGRTPKALARNVAYQKKVLAEYREKVRLSEEYHAETARLRECSGVEKVKARIKAAEKELADAANTVSWEPAHTLDGLRLKVDALRFQDDGLAVYLQSKGGALGGMARFIDATLAVIGRATA